MEVQVLARDLALLKAKIRQLVAAMRRRRRRNMLAWPLRTAFDDGQPQTIFGKKEPHAHFVSHAPERCHRFVNGNCPRRKACLEAPQIHLLQVGNRELPCREQTRISFHAEGEHDPHEQDIAMRLAWGFCKPVCVRQRLSCCSWTLR